MNKLVVPNDKWLATAEKNLNELLERYGKELDFRIATTGKLCGDVIEQLHSDIIQLRSELAYTKDLIVATSEAFDRYPHRIVTDEGDRIDVGEWMREAFIDGYMHQK